MPAAELPAHCGEVQGLIMEHAQDIATLQVSDESLATFEGWQQEAKHEGIGRTSPRAISAFAVNAVLSILIGIALLAPVSRRSGGAGKVLVVMAGFLIMCAPAYPWP